MTDKTYKKQLEKFGIESTRVIDGDPIRKRLDDTAETMLGVVKDLMDSIEGRQWIYSKLALCGVFATPYIPGHPEDTAFQCGMQEIGHHLQREVEVASPKNYYLMVEEASTRALNATPKND